MKNRVDRRSFLKSAALATGALSAQQIISSPNILHAANRGEKVRCVIVGCGGRGSAHLSATLNEHLVALVDVDEKRHAVYKKLLSGKGRDGSKVETFTDYRRMFDKLQKGIDAVFVATPNHHHAPPSMIAMQLGKNVYCEKPLCHDIAEARKLREMSHKYKVATQMGNQGHCDEGYRRLCEFVWGGVIGNITETHGWCDRSNGGVGPRPPTLPVPEGMHWDEWIGPAPYRDFHSDLVPHEWHGWYDFGNGSLGNLACHVMDGSYWSLKLDHPESVELEAVAGGTDERCPTGTRIRWDCPARGDLPPVKVYWYDGYLPADSRSAETAPQTTAKPAKKPKRVHFLPPLLAELQAKYPKEKFDSNGSLYVGDKGIIYTGCYGENMHVLPKEKMSEITQPPKTLPRPKHSFENFLSAVREGRTDTAASFEYGAQLTEFVLLGNLAQHAGTGKKVEWNGAEMRVTNLPELNRFVTRQYRKGWEIG
jgi:predicted dehydrogenase